MIERGDRVTVHYALSIEPGSPVESTFDSEPAVFRYESGEFPAGLERRLAELAPGDELEFIIPAREGVFGSHDPANRYSVERDLFEAIPYETGALVEFDLPNGEQVSGRIEGEEGDKVIVDFNHPLAGRDVHCRLALLEVDKSGVQR